MRAKRSRSQFHQECAKHYPKFVPVLAVLQQLVTPRMVESYSSTDVWRVLAPIPAMNAMDLRYQSVYLAAGVRDYLMHTLGGPDGLGVMGGYADAHLARVLHLLNTAMFHSKNADAADAAKRDGASESAPVAA